MSKPNKIKQGDLRPFDPTDDWFDPLTFDHLFAPGNAAALSFHASSQQLAAQAAPSPTAAASGGAGATTAAVTAQDAAVDLTSSGNSGNVGGAAFSAQQVKAAGAGSFPAFLRLAHSGSEQGYNSDARPVQFDETNSANQNHSLLLANIPLVEGDGSGGSIDGVMYREFLLDANEGSGGNNKLLSLDRLQIFQETSGSLTGFVPGVGFSVAGEHLVYDLDADGDVWIALDASLSSGSGESDVRVLIPDIYFDPSIPYVYLYSAFGLTGGEWASNNGNEEWAVRNGGSGPGGGSKAALNITKQASVPGGTVDTAGETISYTMKLYNTGNVNLTGIVVSDPYVGNLTRGADIVGNNDNVLNVGEIWSYTAEHVVTQDDLDATQPGEVITNTVTADSDQTGPDTASATVPVERRPHATLVKTGAVQGGTIDQAGDVINYQFAVTNDGNITLLDPVVTDPSLSFAVPVLDGNAPIVNPNVQFFIPIMEGDYNLGDTDNDGIEEVTDHNGVWDPGETFQFVYVGDTDQDGFHDPGETWVAFNLGDTNNNNVHDPGEIWVGDTNQNGIEEEGERWQFKNLGDVNQNRVQDDGETWQYANLGDTNVNGVQDPGETFQYYNIGDTNRNGIQDPGETFQYYNIGDTNHNGVEDPGETFQFTIFSTVTAVDTDNDGFNDGDTNKDGKLSVGETWLYVGSYTVTQDDLDNRINGVPTVDPGLTHDNTATLDASEGITVQDSVSLPIAQSPDFSVGKSASVASVDAAGDVITYTVTVDNSGNMTLTGITVSDPRVTNLAYASGDADNDNELDVNEIWIYSGSYTVTQDDLDNRINGVPTFDPDLTLDNTVTVGTQQTGTKTASASVAVVQNPDLTIVKTADVASVDAAGDVINYTVTVANAGNMTLTGITVTDPFVTNLAYASGDTNSDGKLDLTETWTYSGSHVVTQAEMDAGGSIDNTASADSAQTDPESDSASVLVEQHAGMTLLKEALGYHDVNGNEVADEGDEIVYQFTLTNTGNITLHNLGVTDTNGDVVVSGTAISSLAPGASDDTSWSAAHLISATDVSAGYVDNTASAVADETSVSSGTVHTVLHDLLIV